MLIALLSTAVILACVAAAVWRLYSRPARLDRPDEVLARQRIDAIRAMPAPDELVKAPDVTRGMRRRFTRRDHPIARKRSGRPI